MIAFFEFGGGTPLRKGVPPPAFAGRGSLRFLRRAGAVFGDACGGAAFFAAERRGLHFFAAGRGEPAFPV